MPNGDLGPWGILPRDTQAVLRVLADVLTALGEERFAEFRVLSGYSFQEGLNELVQGANGGRVSLRIVMRVLTELVIDPYTPAEVFAAVPSGQLDAITEALYQEVGGPIRRHER